MLLTVVTFLPALGALLVFLLPRERPELAKATSVAVTAVTFLVSLPLFLGFNPADAGYQFSEQRPWMPSLGISYHVGIDGISVLLVLLTTFLTPLTMLSAWHAIESRWKEFAITMLLLETGMIGVFVALDLFLFYIFWEAMLIPMYLIIGIWGGPNRVYAAIKFVLYTLSGSLLMLVAILALYFRYGAATGTYTFDLPVLAQFVLPAGGAQNLLFLAFALAFAIKVPMFPFHTWLPDAHVEAPTAGQRDSRRCALEDGHLRVPAFCLPLFPNASLTFTPWIFALAVIGIVYGAWSRPSSRTSRSWSRTRASATSASWCSDCSR
jgi:NADH-quinone oxidoreductase subunit M